MNPLRVFVGACLVFSSGIFVYNSWVSRSMAEAFVRTERDPVTGIMAGAGPIVYETNSASTACLLVHGFAGSPSEFGRLPELLRSEGYSVYAPLLPGHGTDPREFSKVTPDDLTTTVRNHYWNLKKRYKHVVVIGSSMGASLSLILASENQIDSLVLLAPYLKIKHYWYYVLPVEWTQRMLVPFIPYVYRLSLFKQVYKEESLSKIINYRYISLKGAGTAFSVAHKAHQALQKINVPTLVIHSKKDKSTDFKSSLDYFGNSNGKPFKFVPLERSNHLILLDYEAERVEMEILDFIAHETKETR